MDIFHRFMNKEQVIDLKSGITQVFASGTRKRPIFTIEMVDARIIITRTDESYEIQYLAEHPEEVREAPPASQEAVEKPDDADTTTPAAGLALSPEENSALQDAAVLTEDAPPARPDAAEATLVYAKRSESLSAPDATLRAAESDDSAKADAPTAMPDPLPDAGALLPTEPAGADTPDANSDNNTPLPVLQATGDVPNEEVDLAPAALPEDL